MADSVEITEDDALEFASAMAGEQPPVNQKLIRKHIQYWEEQPSEYGEPIVEWYEQWLKNLSSESYIEENAGEFDAAYQNFTRTLRDIGVDF